jgi:hypothetical protein
MNKLRKNIENNSIYISLKRNQTARNKLKKEVNDLYKENYKPLKKRSKKTTKGGKISCAHALVEST